MLNTWTGLHEADRRYGEMNDVGICFQTNCVAASVGEYNKVIWYYKLSWRHKSVTIKSFKADVSSVSPSSDAIDK